MTDRLRAVVATALLAMVTFAVPVRSLVAQAATDTAGVELMYGVRVPMKDGVTLSATIYKPKR